MAARPPVLARLRRLAADRRGTAALEFGVVGPALAVTLVAVADLGFAVEQSLRLEAAAHAGAQYAASFPTDPSGIRAAVRAALPGWDDVTVAEPAMVCECPGSGGSPGCGASCEGMRRYISIVVTRPARPVLLPGPTVVSGDVLLRVR